MKTICFSAIVAILALTIVQNASAAPANGQEQQSNLDHIAETLQRVQNMAAGMPSVTNMTQQVLNELSQFRSSRLFFANPCQFFQSMFRTFYCSIAAFDPQRTNPAIQGLLQFLQANQIYFNFASNFFCPFAAFTPTTSPPSSNSNQNQGGFNGGSGNGFNGGNPNGFQGGNNGGSSGSATSSSSGAISCPASSPTSGSAPNTNSLTADLDDPSTF